MSSDPAILTVFDQIMKYRRRLKEEQDEPEKVRYSLKRLCALDAEASVIENANIIKLITKLQADDRNGKLAQFLLEKWRLVIDKSASSSSSSSHNSTSEHLNSPKQSKPAKQSKSTVKMPRASSTMAMLDTIDLFAPTPPPPIQKLAIKRKTVERKEKPEEERPALSLPDIKLPSTKLDWKALQRADADFDKKQQVVVAAAAAKQQSSYGDQPASYVPSVKKWKPQPLSSFSERRDPKNHAKKGEDALDAIVNKPKQSHQAMFSGRRLHFYSSVPTLFDACMFVICANVDAIEDTGDIPYEILEPALKRASPEQLYNIEQMNPYLIEDSQQLWQQHCSREFRCGPSAKEADDEHWRDIYQLKLAQRDDKLKELKCSIKKQHNQKQLDQQSVTKLSEPKAPRDVRRLQAKFGTGARGKGGTDILELTRAKRDMMQMTNTQRKFQKPKAVREMMTKSDASTVVYEKERVSKTSRAPAGAAPMMRKSMKMFKNAGRR